MARRSLNNGGLLHSFDDVHSAALQEVERFRQTLTNLQFEGKSSLGRNINQIRSILQFFRSELMKHVELEEQVLFPFVEEHIPKLESLICILRAEHAGFRDALSDLELFLSVVSDGKPNLERAKMIHRLCETGSYLIYLLENHFRGESQSVYEMTEYGLKPSEKKELKDQIENFGVKGALSKH